MTARPARSAAAGEVPSPCVSVCALDPAGGYCLGCFRTLDEIAEWINFDAAKRLAIWDAIALRRKAGDAHR
jgi:predicted Fe-S protein YdhL (DUF1289 family)